MTRDTSVTLHKGTAAVLALGLVLAGAGAAYVLTRIRPASTPQIRSAPPPGGGPPVTTAAIVPNDAPLPDVVVTLSDSAITRAGVVVAPVVTGTSRSEHRLPGVVQPNAYHEVTVTPLVGGRVTKVVPALGDRVRRGQTLAEIYSPTLAEAQTRYISAKAMLEAHDRELQRTQTLVDIGAASRQELERIHAEHASQSAAVQSARSQLELLGLSTSAVERLVSGQKVGAITSVPAPIDGVVTERGANVGFNVDPATKLFTIVDLSTVWIVADLYEKDFSHVHVGTDVAITKAARPDATLRGRVSYIDPQVSAATRTAKLRIEVPNANGELRLGMYADVVVTGSSGTSTPMVPRTAVQNVGDRSVVYLANPKEPGTFTEREVRLGHRSGDRVAIVSGVQAGDTLVTQGSFFVRAERERLGLRPPPITAAAGAAARVGTDSASGTANVQSGKIVVNDQGFEPPKISLRAGTPARITFLRTTDKTCATEIVFPSLTIKRALPLNEPVVIAFTPAKAGDIAFACGMDMLKGVVIIE